MVYNCTDGRECSIGFEHQKPCYIFSCANPCLWDFEHCPKYDIKSESEECPVALCTEPPTPPTPPTPPPPPDSGLPLVDIVVICLAVGILLGIINISFFKKKMFHVIIFSCRHDCLYRMLLLHPEPTVRGKDSAPSLIQQQASGTASIANSSE